MRLRLSVCIFLCTLFFLAGCDGAVEKKEADYRYFAQNGEYEYVITPRCLTLSRQDGLWGGHELTVEGGVIGFAGFSRPLPPNTTVLQTAELMYKIFMGELDTETEKSGECLKITGVWGSPFTLTLDKNSLEPRSLYWIGENILFKEQ